MLVFRPLVGAGLSTVATAARQLGSLVDKSLVHFDEASGRDRLLETVRSFVARSSRTHGGRPPHGHR